jgi:hypothetical protein
LIFYNIFEKTSCLLLPINLVCPTEASRDTAACHLPLCDLFELLHLPSDSSRGTSLFQGLIVASNHLLCPGFIAVVLDNLKTLTHQ